VITSGPITFINKHYPVKGELFGQVEIGLTSIFKNIIAKLPLIESLKFESALAKFRVTTENRFVVHLQAQHQCNNSCVITEARLFSPTTLAGAK